MVKHTDQSVCYRTAPMRRGAIALGGVLTVLVTAGPARAARVETIETPSRHVDPATAIFAGGGHVDGLRANVLLPDGYDEGDRRHPVLYLLHPTGGDYRTWLEPEAGDIAELARGLDAIVVMPEGGLGFMTNWWNDGRRADPGWERFYLDELVPLVESRYRILPGRRWHGIAGYSMGGMGAVFLAGQRPGYFGTAVSLSGFVSIQRPYLQSVWQAGSGVEYEQLWGPSTGFYATGHNPAALTDNLGNSRLIVAAGDGKPRPGVPFGPAGPVGAPFQSVLETEVRMESDDLVTAARDSGVDVTYFPHDGIHDWPYIREDLRSAIGLGLFEPVPDDPTRWSYRTVAQAGEAWGLRFSFSRAPEEVTTLARDGQALTGEGSGTVTITTPGDCVLTVDLPFRVVLPAAPCTNRRIGLRVAPRRVRRGARRRLRIRATTLLRGRTVGVPRARLRVGGRAVLTKRDGRRSVRVRVTRRRKRLRILARKPGLRGAKAIVRVLPPS